MRALSILLAFLLVVFGLIGHARAASDDVQAILQRGELVVAVQSQGPPNSFIDKNDERVGFYIDIVKAIAADMGVKLKMVDYDFRGLIPAVTAGKVDFAAADIAPTPQRALVLTFTEPVYDEPAVMYAKKGRFTDLHQLNQSGIRLGVVAGSANKRVLETQFPNAMIVELAGGGPALLEGIATSRIDAAINLRSSAEANMAMEPGQFEIVGGDVYSWPEAFGVLPDQTHLVVWLNNWIYWAKRDGRIAKWAAYWRQGDKWRADHQ